MRAEPRQRQPLLLYPIDDSQFLAEMALQNDRIVDILSVVFAIRYDFCYRMPFRQLLLLPHLPHFRLFLYHLFSRVELFQSQFLAGNCLHYFWQRAVFNHHISVVRAYSLKIIFGKFSRKVVG